MNKTYLGLFWWFFSLLSNSFLYSDRIKLGVEVFFSENHLQRMKGKNIGIITNHTGVDGELRLTVDRFIDEAKECNVKALFSPEHGMNGLAYAGDSLESNKYKGINVYSLHGKSKRPTKEMFEGIDVLIYDIQDIGSRSYTYSTTLFYVMEEAKSSNIEVIVLDRPNPINGLIVDGPMLEEKFRSFLGYVNVAYCHGMTIGELASFFNGEYKIGCKLTVVPMKGWTRQMSFEDTALHWIPSSPNIPEADTPYYYPTTGILGELKILNIGIGYTMPFKVVGAPWLDGKKFSEVLNSQNLPGVKFIPFHFRPFYGLYKGEDCQGVKIIITDKEKIKPLAVQYLILGMLKSLYPKIFLEKLEKFSEAKENFHKVNGTDEVYNLLVKEPYPAWKLIELHELQKKEFLEKREKYLIKEYSQTK